MTTFLGMSFSAFANLFAGIVVPVGTVLSVIISGQSVVEARKLRQMQNEPHIVVTLYKKSQFSPLLNAWIENIGTGAAYDLRLTTDKEIPPFNNQDLSQVGVFAHGIPCFPPGHQLVFLLGERSKMLQADCRTLSISATYRTVDKAVHSEAFPIDIESLAGMSDKSPLDDIADGLSTIGRKLVGF